MTTTARHRVTQVLQERPPRGYPVGYRAKCGCPAAWCSGPFRNSRQAGVQGAIHVLHAQQGPPVAVDRK